ncbi:GNAT family N-acetyltransferase [Heyndrickxia oleronia]|uniref:GNAT family N-acetyltransferase n=1 Tax=Heyndrickxia oleronia TaxID=38875 RepID=UPI0037523220
MIIKLENKHRDIAQKILKVQIPSYRVEADIIGYSDIPPLKDTVEHIQKCQETFYGYIIEEELCGVISFKVNNGVVDIHRLIVHPNHFRKGIAQHLLDHILRSKDYVAMKVSTGSKNTPAVQLYYKNGFQKIEEIVVDESLSISCFEKQLNKI